MEQIRVFLNELKIPFNEQNDNTSRDFIILKYKIRFLRCNQTIIILKYKELGIFDPQYHPIFTFYENDKNINRIKSIILEEIVDYSYISDIYEEIDKLRDLYFNISNEKTKKYISYNSLYMLKYDNVILNINQWNPIEIIKQLKNKINEYLSLYEPETGPIRQVFSEHATGPLYLMSQEWFEMIIE